MTQKTPVIEAANLTVSIPEGPHYFFQPTYRLDILIDVSIAVSPGEIVCVVGESGSGKTTFGRALLGLLRPSGGEIRLDGVALADFSKRVSARCAKRPPCCSRTRPRPSIRASASAR
ncbi:ATP-binding cassette domain-containing protein (plasmid) [Rhizobium sp. RCAM05350]|nr:ATP-binding cassette domain-containing protein [Rhizobium sp. RCAM05350]